MVQIGMDQGYHVWEAPGSSDDRRFCLPGTQRCGKPTRRSCLELSDSSRRTNVQPTCTTAATTTSTASTSNKQTTIPFTNPQQDFPILTPTTSPLLFPPSHITANMEFGNSGNLSEGTWHSFLPTDNLLCNATDILVRQMASTSTWRGSRRARSSKSSCALSLLPMLIFCQPGYLNVSNPRSADERPATSI